MPSSTRSFTAWLRDSSTWVPLKMFLKAKPEELVAAGYPEGAVKAFLDAYHELEQAEASYPALAEPAAAAFVERLAIAGRGRGPTAIPSVADDRARDPVQRDQPVLAGAVRLCRAAWCSWS